MNPLALTVFLASLAIGTTITMSSHHWLLAWIGLEINTLAIIPIMTKTPHPRAIEAATKYFLTQATASTLLLFSALINAWQTGEWTTIFASSLTTTPIAIALMTKLGLAPMHFWMPEVMQGIPLSAGLILSTWQKIAPMSLLLQIAPLIDLKLTVTLGLISILVGGWGGINQTQLRKVMAFSSIGHLGWIILIIKFSPQLALFNFTLYLLMTLAMFLILMATNTTKMQDITTIYTKTPSLAPIMMLILLSLAGLPPLTGFAPKLLITSELVKQDATLLATLALISSLLALFFYLRLAYIITLTMPPNNSYSSPFWYRQTKVNSLTALLATLALLIFPLSPTLLLLM
uniref:NADH-ubiquinone oxidoreductase chain 2 n=1 Tax=Gephyromantis pseudoasper TaxID=161781 RepID=B2DCB6_9NEOB|nr:NADH dehydrogenase subunit 2 [Gephyromantis pseudoasper]